MKKYSKLVCLIYVIVNSLAINAQSDTTKVLNLKNRLVDSICTCIEKTDTSTVNNMTDASQMITRCITNNMELLGEYAEANGVDWLKISKEKLQDLTKYIAAEVYFKCAAMKTMINRVRSKQNQPSN
jgi:hypothetical protein